MGGARRVMDIGKLDRRIRIEQRATVDGDYGPQPGDWTTFATVWANIQETLPSRGETQAQGIRIAERPARVRIRYLDGVNSAMRVVWLDRGNRLLKILTPAAELGRRDGMEFMVADFSTQGEAT